MRALGRWSAGVVGTVLVSANPTAFASTTAAPAPNPSISGVVRGLTGDPVGGVEVRLYSPDGRTFETSEVSNRSTGHYQVFIGTHSRTPNNNYLVCFDPANADLALDEPGYRRQCYAQVAWPSGSLPTGTPVHATATSPATGIDAHLRPSAGIAGEVTGAGGVPLHGVPVYLYSARAGVGDPALTYTHTDTDGRYAFHTLGSRTVRRVLLGLVGRGTVGSPGGYDSECWKNAPTRDTATRIVLAGNEFRAHVDARLRAYGAISGTVTAAASGQPLAGGFVVTAFDAAGRRSGRLVSGAGGPGTYLLGALPAGESYTVCVGNYPRDRRHYPSGLRAQCYDHVAWDTPAGELPSGTSAVPTRAGTVSAGVNFALEPGGGVRGQVTLPTTSAAGTTVEAYDSAGRLAATTLTSRPHQGRTGGYALLGLAPGRYSICFDNVTNSWSGLSECHADVPWTGPGSPLPPGRTGVRVRAGHVVPDVDATLAQSGSAQVRLTTLGAGLVREATVLVLDAAGTVVTRARAVNGFLDLNLPASVEGYTLCVENAMSDGGPTLPQCYRNKPWDGDLAHVPARAMPVPIATGETVTGLEFVLTLPES